MFIFSVQVGQNFQENVTPFVDQVMSLEKKQIRSRSHSPRKAAFIFP